MDTWLSLYLFTSSWSELLLLSLIVLFAGAIRGAIGFGFSALVVASAGTWLAPSHVVSMVVVLEVIASIMMWHSTRDSLNPAVLMPLTLGTALLIPFGLWVLVSLSYEAHQLIMLAYLLVVALLILLAIQFSTQPGKPKLALVGAIAGFFSGLAGIGGLFVAMFLNGSAVSGRDIRATLSIYFFFTELVFIVGAWINGVLNGRIILTALVIAIPMYIGIHAGIHLFQKMSESRLKQMVLVALIILSLSGLLRLIL